MVDVARANRRKTLEARRARKLALAPTFGDDRGKWLLRLMRSRYDPDACQREGKR
jgi:hypothetical protein